MDELRYGQIREVSPGVHLVLLSPGEGETWNVMAVLDSLRIPRPHFMKTGDIQTPTANFLRDLPLVEEAP